MEEKSISETKVEKIMISKLSLIIGIITPTIISTAIVVGFFYKIQIDVALIKQNHEAHMQTALEKIAELEKQEIGLMNKLDKDHEAIIQLMTIHPVLKK